MDDDASANQAYGVFKPVGHVLLSFPGEDEARSAVEALGAAGFAGRDVTFFPAADVGRRFRADRAQHYGRFIIEELIEPGDGEAQVAESPDRGLDAQTPSGDEKTRLT